MSIEILLLSPHPDDLCFAMAGTLLTMPIEKCYVSTIFTDKIFTIDKQPIEVVKEIVLEEEKKAMIMANKCYELENFKDAQLRGYKRLSEILGPNIEWKSVVKKEEYIINELIKCLNSLKKKFQPKSIRIPLGIGNHVDHILVREASIHVFKDDSDIIFYEDMPYSANIEWYKQGLDEICQRFILEEERIYLSQIKEKESLIECYHSQLSNRDRSLMKHFQESCRDEYGYFERFWNLKSKNLTS